MYYENISASWTIMNKSDEGKCANGSRGKNKIPNRLIRVVLIIAGTLFVGLGVLGIIVT